MLIFTKITELQNSLEQFRSQGRKIGFVPTMGALHKGHISLINASKKSCDVTVCSIFVNPTQFNDKKDLERYPRMPEADTEMLKEAKCDILFMPSVDEVYQTPDKQYFDFGYLDKILEGRYRPGHFIGVAQVVKRLFEIVQPHMAFFGSKDYQQVLVVKALVKEMGTGIEVVACPILREDDGLAMSSRNLLLKGENRTTAGKINSILNKAARVASQNGVESAKQLVVDQVGQLPSVKLDYVEICDAESLMPLDELSNAQPAVMLIALYVGEVRLIDNVKIPTS